MAAKTVEITYEDQGNKASCAAHVPGIEGEGELTILKVSATLIIADHTFLPDSLRGSHAATALVQRLIEDTRVRRRRIVPTCRFVRTQVQRHPEWADVIRN